MTKYKFFVGCSNCLSLVNITKKEIPFGKLPEICENISNLSCKYCKEDTLYLGIYAHELTSKIFNLYNFLYNNNKLDSILDENIILTGNNKLVASVYDLLPFYNTDVQITFNGYKNKNTIDFLNKNKLPLDKIDLPCITVTLDKVVDMAPISIIDLYDTLLLTVDKIEPELIASYLKDKDIKELQYILEETIDKGRMPYV